MPLWSKIESGKTTPFSTATSAKQSAVHWHAGEEPRSTCLLRNPKRLDVHGREFLRVQGWSFEVQQCICVPYDPGMGLKGPGCRDLVEVAIAPKLLETGEQDVRWAGGGVQRYRVVAAVRLSTPE